MPERRSGADRRSESLRSEEPEKLIYIFDTNDDSEAMVLDASDIRMHALRFSKKEFVNNIAGFLKANVPQIDLTIPIY